MLPADEYYASLPRRRVAAGMLITDADDRILIVEPTYKTDWDMPGGIVEDGETPPDAARREIREELGLDLPPGRLLAVGHTVELPPKGDLAMFVYDGGVLDDPARIRLDERELASFRFVATAELPAMLPVRIASRLALALEARRTGTVQEEIDAAARVVPSTNFTVFRSLAADGTWNIGITDRPPIPDVMLVEATGLTRDQAEATARALAASLVRPS